MTDYMSPLRRLCSQLDIYNHVTSPDSRSTEVTSHNDVTFRRNRNIPDHGRILKDTSDTSYIGHFNFDGRPNDIFVQNTRAVSGTHKAFEENNTRPRLNTCPENRLRHTTLQEANLMGHQKEVACTGYLVDGHSYRNQKCVAVDAHRGDVSITIHVEDVTSEPPAGELKDHGVARCPDDGSMDAVVLRDNCRRTSKRSLVTSKSLPLSPLSASADRASRRLSDIKMAVDKVHTDLIAMQKTDQELAKYLLSMYHEIRLMKIKSKCVRHQELLFDAMDDAADEDQMPDMCDAPKKSMNKILLNHGVTWLNINARRFSCS